MLTNKIISEKLQKPIFTVRRWAKEFLGDDPAAGRQMGVAREITENDAWFMFLGGSIVELTRLEFKTVRKVIDQIKPWLINNGLVPVIPKGAWPQGIDQKMFWNHSLEFLKYQSTDDIAVRFTGIVPKQGHASGEDENGREYESTTYREYEYWLLPHPEGEGKNIWGYAGLKINIRILLTFFMNRICGQDARDEWWRRFQILHQD
jgi:hypothetical protein